MDITIRRAGIEHEPVDEGDSLSVGIDDGSDSGFSTLFMRLSEMDLDSDADLEPYCIVMANGASCYGGILRASITRSALEIDISAEAAAALSADSTELRFRLEVSASEFDELSSGLERVLRPAVTLNRLRGS
jgi:hypothetical protein